MVQFILKVIIIVKNLNLVKIYITGPNENYMKVLAISGHTLVVLKKD